MQIQKDNDADLSTTEGVYKRMWEAYSSASQWKLNVKS